MKKIYLSAAALLSFAFMNAQTAFFTGTTYKGAFPITDGSTGVASNDWTSGWAEWDPENKVYPVPTSTLTGDISTNTSISGVVYLNGFVHVKNNAILTIAPGTIIRCDKVVPSAPSCLIITKGSKIMAQGTALQPIVFTSNEDDLVNVGRFPGDWAGIIILGNGVINTGGVSQNPNVSKVEGFLTVDPLRYYGGNNDADNSGVMSHVRIEFAGISLDPATPNSEINGLTMGGIGSGTQLNHIQVSFSGDDSFEWFGGKVDAKWLIANRGTDDDFDTDFGYRGRIQFGLGIKDADISDISLTTGASNGFESDNSDPINLRFPITKVVFSNMTMIGAKRDVSTVMPVGEKHECAVHLRRNTGQTIVNSLFLGFEKGLRIQNSVTFDNYNAPATFADSMGIFSNNSITSDVALTYVTDNAAGFTIPWYHGYSAANSVDTTMTISQIDFANYAIPVASISDYRLKATSSATTGANFSGPAFAGQVTGIKNVSQSVVNEFVLYPNPATANTNISFTITEKNKVSVNVYDVLGNLVSILSQNNDFEKGKNTISLNTSSLSSGVYYISLDINGTKETKTLIINK
ncbi:MAG: T9SS type A sorting domain-containing protein [Burkholderiales bacterium]|nr:T9SS type A sorting domain-containing protein [Bacteroidia bacterium]